MNIKNTYDIERGVLGSPKVILVLLGHRLNSISSCPRYQGIRSFLKVFESSLLREPGPQVISDGHLLLTSKAALTGLTLFDFAFLLFYRRHFGTIFYERFRLISVIVLISAIDRGQIIRRLHHFARPRLFNWLWIFLLLLTVLGLLVLDLLNVAIHLVSSGSINS